MKRKRRTKQEMQYAWDEAYYWLFQNGNDPQKAYNNMVKDYLLRGMPIPYYMKGMEDFVRVAADIKAAKEEKQRQEDERKDIANQLKKITVEQWREKWEQYKNSTDKDIRLSLVELRNAMHDGDFVSITDHELRCLRIVGLIE